MSDTNSSRASRVSAIWGRIKEASEGCFMDILETERPRSIKSIRQMIKAHRISLENEVDRQLCVFERECETILSSMTTTAEQQPTNQPQKTMSDTPETTPCKHDYFNPRVKGRARYHCPMCDADISLEVVMLVEQELDDKAKEDAKDHEAP